MKKLLLLFVIFLTLTTHSNAQHAWVATNVHSQGNGLNPAKDSAYISAQFIVVDTSCNYITKQVPLMEIMGNNQFSCNINFVVHFDTAIETNTEIYIGNWVSKYFKP